MARRRNRHKPIRRRSLLEQMEARLPLSGDGGHNFLMPGDVNDDRAVSAADALAIINMLAQQRHDGTGAPEGEAVDASFASMFYDVNDDGHTSSADALRVINELASEGESADTVEWLQAESGARARIELEFSGSDRAKLEVRLSGASESQSFELVVDGQVLGQVQTNELGRGKLELTYGGTHPTIPDVLLTANRSTPVSIGMIIEGTFGSLGEIEDQDGDSDGSTDGGVDSIPDSPSDGGTDGGVDGSPDGIPDDSSSTEGCSDGSSDASSDGDLDGGLS